MMVVENTARTFSLSRLLTVFGGGEEGGDENVATEHTRKKTLEWEAVWRPPQTQHT